MGKQNCSGCRFWDGDDNGVRIAGVLEPAVLGTCQRYPPVYTGRGDDGDALERPDVLAFDQPTTMASEWCGEFQERPVEAGQQAAQ